MMIPEIKKKVSSFLLNEDGKISKQSLLSVGSFLTSVAIGTLLASKDAAAHEHSLGGEWQGTTIKGTHYHSSDCTWEDTWGDDCYWDNEGWDNGWGNWDNGYGDLEE